ncbi:hypothetical protein ACQPW1_10215 [Nocardia sp. CA-128927]|uniref:hypothetical protein n=1 Tax=Nocardia sp. CA-128927 TaxID=3239975 RepID=UPI003D9601D6
MVVDILDVWSFGHGWPDLEGGRMQGWSIEVVADTGVLSDADRHALVRQFGDFVMVMHDEETGRTSFGTPVDDKPMRSALNETLDRIEWVLLSVLGGAHLLGVHVISAEDRDAELAAAGVVLEQ